VRAGWHARFQGWERVISSCVFRQLSMAMGHGCYRNGTGRTVRGLCAHGWSVGISWWIGVTIAQRQLPSMLMSREQRDGSGGLSRMQPSMQPPPPDIMQLAVQRLNAPAQRSSALASGQE
jgi:hypothetical protein